SRTAPSREAQDGVPNSPSFATSHCMSSTRKRTAGVDGLVMHGRLNPVRRLLTHISPGPELEYFSRTGLKQSTISSIARSPDDLTLHRRGSTVGTVLPRGGNDRTLWCPARRRDLNRARSLTHCATMAQRLLPISFPRIS